MNNTIQQETKKTLRIWPGVVLVLLQWTLRYLIPEFNQDAILYGVFGVIVFGIGIVIWWLFFSRAPIFERWFAIVLIAISLVAASQLLDKSIATANMGLMFGIYSIPVMCLFFVAWAAITKNRATKVRRISMIITIIFAALIWDLLRTNGMDAEIHHDFAWRWAKTAEEKLLHATSDKLGGKTVDLTTIANKAEWSGFKGNNRDAIVHYTKINTNWKENKPVEMWRREIGPGCSSFSVHGTLLFTQEQRGDFEMVTCYNLFTGEPIWVHQDSARFWDAHAGAGPRSTPTLENGKVYTMGATGILNVLNEKDGSVVWSRNVANDTHVISPGWGYTGSPLVLDSIVFISVSGQILAYCISSGNKLWSGADGGESYSSPQLFVSNGSRQILFMNNAGVTSYEPASGKILWMLKWPGVRIVQPYIVDENDLLISAEEKIGLKRISIKNDNSNWTVEEKWITNKLRPDYNDFVVHKGYIYGFDGMSLTCVDLKDGSRKWKSGKYGGFILLLAEQDLLLILTEQGDITLVKAIPEKLEELAKMPVIKGKTWNHPVLVGNILVVRNAIEMAAFKLTTE